MRLSSLRSKFFLSFLAQGRRQARRALVRATVLPVATILVVMLLAATAFPAPALAAPANSSAPATAKTSHTVQLPAVGLLLRPRLTLSGVHPAWGMQMIRPRMRGTIAGAKWFLQADMASGRAALLDARIQLPLGKPLTLTVGRFISPFSRAFMTPVPRLAFPDFAAPVVQFRVNRDLGSMLTGRAFHDHLKIIGGVFLGTALTGRTVRPVYMGRAIVAWGAPVPHDMAPYLKPSFSSGGAGVALGLSAYTRPGHGTSATGTTAGALPGDTTVGADLALRAGSVICLAEGFLRVSRRDASRTPGALYGQCQAPFFGRSWEAGFRATIPDSRRFGEVSAEALLTHYLAGQGLKVQLRYRLTPGWRNTRADSAHQVTVQMQLNGWIGGS